MDDEKNIPEYNRINYDEDTILVQKAKEEVNKQQNDKEEKKEEE